MHTLNLRAQEAEASGLRANSRTARLTHRTLPHKNQETDRQTDRHTHTLSLSLSLTLGLVRFPETMP